MTKILKLAVAAALISSMLVAVNASAATRTEKKDYYVGLDLQPVCNNGDVPQQLRYDQRIGGACFYLQGDELTADIKITDLTGLPIGSAYIFQTASGTAIGTLTLFCESTRANVPTGAAMLSVYVAGPIVGPTACLLVGGKVGSGGTTGEIEVTFETGTQTGPPPFDVERECLEPAPAAASVSGLTDDGSRVALTVRVLLDGVSLADGQAAFARAADAYAPLGVDMAVDAYETVSFSGTDAYGLNGQARTHLGGQRPVGTDIVYTLTNKNIQASGLSEVAGLADCIGGVRFPERAFAVGEVLGQIDAGPFRFYADGTAKIAGHEIGHLMGGQHHYANCLQGESDLGNGEVTPCSLMFNSLDFMSLDFDTVNGAVVRGHAVQFAQ